MELAQDIEEKITTTTTPISSYNFQPKFWQQSNVGKNPKWSMGVQEGENVSFTAVINRK